jgi:sporulation protein YlmC with PRC-barrel domain
MGFIGFLLRSIVFIFLIGFGAAFYLLIWRPHHAGIQPAAVGSHSASALSIAPAAVGPGGGSASSGIMQAITSKLGIGGAPDTAGDTSAGVKASLAIDHAEDSAAGTVQAPSSQGISQNTTISTPVVIPGAITDIINSVVVDENGQRVGTIYDILVDRHSGLATRVIINGGQPGYQGIDLSEVHFNQVAAQSASGAMRISTSAASVKASQPFDYAQMPKDQYVSLRGLEGSVVLDDQAKSAGQVNAVTYANGSAQNIVYTVPAVVQGGHSVSFVIPYEAIRIITSPAGQAIQLSHAQTAAMAATLFPQAPRK